MPTTRTDNLAKLLRRRAGWKVDDDGAGARYHRRGADWSGLVHAWPARTAPAGGTPR